MSQVSKIQKQHERLVQRTEEARTKGGVRKLRVRVYQSLHERMRAELDARKFS